MHSPSQHHRKGHYMANLEEMGKRAAAAKYKVQALTAAQKNKALGIAADALMDNAKEILAANEKDLANAQAAGMHPGLIDRLRLTRERIAAMAEGLRQIAALKDPIGECLEEFDRPNGMHICKVRVPMGVIGIIYESRPNVTADAFGLCFKSGNAAILRGGSDAIHSNLAITNVLRAALSMSGMPEDALQMIEDTSRETAAAFMKLNAYVDLLIPRGGAGLIRTVVEQSSIPAIETGTGNCHVYVDEEADLTKAVNIVVNAKTQRIGVCNACESLVVHEAVSGRFLPMLADALRAHNVEMRADEQACSIISDAVPASEEDYAKEYLDYIISIKTVGNVQEAIAHINRYNTKHSEAIVTENADTARQFLEGVDAACVYHNVSTRFTDGFEFGFGAEIGISTQKLHARGPMGLKELTSYKYRIEGNGQVRT